MCPGPLGQEQSPFPGKLGFRTRGRDVDLRSGLGKEGEWRRVGQAAPLGAVWRAEGLEASWCASVSLYEGGRCGEVGAGRDLFFARIPSPELLVSERSNSAWDATLRSHQLGVL